MKEVDFKMGFAVVEWIQAFIKAMNTDGMAFEEIFN